MALDERHPDAERLAEYADDVLDADARAEVERHLADCAECRAVVMETLAFLHSPANTTNVPASRVVPFRARRRVTAVAVGLAAAAALVLAIRVARPEWVGGLFGSRGDRPELQELIAAVANEPTRLVEGRLSGGFKYGPPPSPTRGPGDREVSPDVRIAAAQIEKQAGARDTPASIAAVGVASLILGDRERAIGLLEDAIGRAPDSPTYLVDLAAAYAARAAASGAADDWVKALSAADRARRIDPARPEACFNRALALEGLHLTEQALQGWAECQMLDTGLWATEIGTHIAALRR
jgi:tetratricopeptide (TPR) repeat protein